MLKRLISFFSYFILLTLTSAVNASLISGPDIISAPSLISDDNGAVNWAQQGFDEAQNVLLTQNLKLDEGIIKAGLRVDSHMIFFNTPGHVKARDVQSWSFGGDILGVISNKNILRKTHSFLGHKDATYQLNFNLVGLEKNDNYSFKDNILDLTMQVSEPGDWIRVITDSSSANVSSVPIPSAVWLFGTALFGFVGLHKKQTIDR